jgi:hypothetical protein
MVAFRDQAVDMTSALVWETMEIIFAALELKSLHASFVPFSIKKIEQMHLPKTSDWLSEGTQRN